MIMSLFHMTFLPFFFSLFYSAAIFSEQVSDTISFSNFNQLLTLVKQDKQGYTYRLENSKEQVILSNRLIVKTTKKITQLQLAGLHPLIDEVTPLFVGSDFDYYSVELDDISSMSLLLVFLSKENGIELVQPDILQLGIKTAAIPDLSENKIIGSESLNSSLLNSNIAMLWRYTKGKGVKIAIIDDGFNLQHQELRHISTQFAYDLETRMLTSSPRSQQDNHGTKVAGIIFSAHDQKGTNGIAPQAELISLRHPDTWTSKTLLSFQLARLAMADVINCSWVSPWLLQPVADVVNELAATGRNGKGIAVVFAAGNQGKEIKPDSTEASINGAIVVGACNHKFQPLRNSNYGQSVDLFAYGGRARTTLASGGYGNFSGTSLAAAIVSGMAALLLAQFPDMTLKQLEQELKLLSKVKNKKVNSE